MAKKNKLLPLALTVFTTVLLLTIISIQAIDTASEEESRVILTFDSNKDKQEFLDTLESNQISDESQRGIFSIGQSEIIVDESNIAEDDFGELPIITLDVTPQEKTALTELVEQFTDAEITPVQKKTLFLADSVPLINATQIWRLNQSYDSSLTAQNVTGKGQSACVIDTGIRANHVDFTGKTIVQKCYCAAQADRASDCCPNGLDEDTNASDSNGHGTHVAGIIAANGVVKGVAPDANIISVKVFGSDNATYDDDLIKAIQYCTNNSATYNISVISMSLGGGTFSGLCPADVLEPAISAALAKNISVVVATGNGGRTNAISSPACVPGVIQVAATSKSDTLASFSDTNPYTWIVAPGVDIISTYKDGNYAQLDGTSMSTPHVSGAILLLKNGLASVNISKTPAQIESAINSTAKIIFSPTRGRSFNRIDVYNALVTLGANINFTSPTQSNATYILQNNFLINATTKNLLLRSINISIYNSAHQLEWTQNSTSQPIEFNFTTLNDGTYYYNVTAIEIQNNLSYSTETRSITIDALAPFLLNYSTSISNQTAHIYTTVDSYSNATIQYGTNDSLTYTIYNSTNTTNHEFILTGLANSTTYYFNITFVDYRLNTTTNGTYNFTTLGTFIELNNSEWNTTETTDFTLFTQEQLSNISQVNFSNTNGKITFTDSLNLSQPRNITNAIIISQNRIIVNTTILPEFNVSANLTFRNITLTHPIVKRNNLDCSTSNGNCTNQNFNTGDNTYVVRVSMFSTYDLVEQCTDSVQNYDEDGVDCGGNNCDACPPSGGGGGGSGSARPTPIKTMNSTNITTTTNVTLNVTLNASNTLPKLNLTSKENSSVSQVSNINRTNSTKVEDKIVENKLDVSQISSYIIVTLISISVIYFILRK